MFEEKVSATITPQNGSRHKGSLFLINPPERHIFLFYFQKDNKKNSKIMRIKGLGSYRGYCHNGTGRMLCAP
ncbi:hypothetical protein QLX67_03565 [Balneolaceae bacterium ANBcel3]|nr:hypothetical protein [Balneolaceae bacterium ANBcel3]